MGFDANETAEEACIRLEAECVELREAWFKVRKAYVNFSYSRTAGVALEYALEEFKRVVDGAEPRGVLFAELDAVKAERDQLRALNEQQKSIIKKEWDLKEKYRVEAEQARAGLEEARAESAALREALEDKCLPQEQECGYCGGLTAVRHVRPEALSQPIGREYQERVARLVEAAKKAYEYIDDDLGYSDVEQDMGDCRYDLREAMKAFENG